MAVGIGVIDWGDDAPQELRGDKTFHSIRTFLQDPPAAFDGIFDWRFISGPVQEATGRAITPMDIDACVEIRGHHLLVEKKGEGGTLSDGQKRALRGFWARGYTTLLYLGTKVVSRSEITCPQCNGTGKTTCEKQVPTRAEFHFPRSDKLVLSQPTHGLIFNQIYQWARYADKFEAPFQYAPEYDGR